PDISFKRPGSLSSRFGSSKRYRPKADCLVAVGMPEAVALALGLSRSSCGAPAPDAGARDVSFSQSAKQALTASPVTTLAPTMPSRRRLLYTLIAIISGLRDGKVGADHQTCQSSRQHANRLS